MYGTQIIQAILTSIVTANRKKVRRVWYTNNTSDRYCIVTANSEKVRHVWYTVSFFLSFFCRSVLEVLEILMHDAGMCDARIEPHKASLLALRGSIHASHIPASRIDISRTERHKAIEIKRMF